MNYLHHLIRSKGILNVPRRFMMIYRRFGFTGVKSARALNRLLEITDTYRCKPSLFITADLLEHHDELIQGIAGRDVDLALHGHHHIDHALLEGSHQRDEIAKGIEKFRKHGLEVSGFRGPFLRFNDETEEAVATNGLPWVSQTVMLFNGTTSTHELNQNNKTRHVLKFYTQKSHVQEPSIPGWGSHCLEIPVSLPDDEIIIDRLGITDASKITEIWLDMLKISRRQGELLNVVLHPERIDLVAKPLSTLLETAVSQGDIWVAPLHEISQWWHERSSSSLEIRDDHGSETCQIWVNGSRRASLALSQPSGAMDFIDFERNRPFTISNGFRPVIGLSPDFCDKGGECLINEGFVVETNGDLSRCAFTFNGTCTMNRRQLLESLKQAQGPLVRMWRWPNGFKSALAITADVDAITLWDFIRRAGHFRKVRSC